MWTTRAELSTRDDQGSLPYSTQKRRSYGSNYYEGEEGCLRDGVEQSRAADGARPEGAASLGRGWSSDGFRCARSGLLGSYLMS